MSPAGRFDVAIVGYGPVGALLACLLGKQGLSVAVLERESGILQSPRAIHFDGESMRIFQAAGVAGAMGAVTRGTTKGMHFVNAAGRTLMVRRGMVGIGPHGWHNDYYFHQPDLEQVLRQAAESHSGVCAMLETEAVALGDRGDHAQIEIRSAGGRTALLEARYVVGCDGARSLVRRSIASGSEDLGLHQPWLVIDLVLKRELDLPDHTVQHCNPERPMTQCYVTGRRRRWEIMLMPGDDPDAMVRPETAWALLRRWISPPDAEMERAAVYTFHSVISSSWRRGRLLIAGDSAHQSPPFLGQGMCAGVRDCANLAWKLARVLRGKASESLLDTYETERKPHVRAFIELAVRIGSVIQATDPRIAAERDRRIEQGTPELFDFPQPQLGSGVRADGPPPAGIVFPQPRLAEGRLLDESIGERFAVPGSRDVLSAVNREATAAWKTIDVMAIADPGPGVDDWLRERGAEAVLLRPDRYVFGIAPDAAALSLLTDELVRRASLVI